MVESLPIAAALEYAAKGWPVIPLHTPTGNTERPCSCNKPKCESIGKHPRTMNGIKDATTEEAKIRRWWEQWPKANIGGELGQKSGRFAGDIDPRNGGAETLAALVARYGELPTTLTALTGGIGHHYVFKWPDGYAGKLKGSLGPGIDIKGDGGFIVLAPSLHASGAHYRWLNDAPIADAPAWMIEELRESKRETVAGEVADEIPEGQRNSALASLGGSMRRRGMTAEEIEAALLIVNERRCNPPLDAGEVRKIAESVSRYAPANSQGYRADALPPEEPPELDAAFTPSQSTKAGGKEPVLLAVSWADFDAEQFMQGERIAFAAERGEIALLNALPNAGKTTLALNVAIALAAGRIFTPVVTDRKPRRVLYIDGETRRARLQRDLRTMTKGFSREEAMAVGENLHIICEAEIKGEALALTRTDHLLQLSLDALRVKPDFIVIDTLSSLCPVFNENDNAEQTRKVWRPLQKIARDCDAAMLVNHHVGKRSEDSLAPERVYRGRGASASGGAARAVWLLIPDPVTPGLSTLSCVKAKGESPADVRLQLDPATRWVRHLEALPPPPTPLELVVAAVTEEVTTAQVVAELKDRLKARAVKDYLGEAVERGLIRKIKYGVYGPKSAESAECAKDENAQSAQSVQSKKAKSAQSALPIESAHSALSGKPNGVHDLSKSAQSALPIEACTPCTLGKTVIPSAYLDDDPNVTPPGWEPRF